MLESAEKLFRFSPDIVFICDNLGKAIWKNEIAAKHMAGEIVRDLFVEPDDFDSMLRADFIGVGDKTYILRNGWLAHTAAVTLDEQNSYFVTIRDVRDLDLLTKEEELRKRVTALSGFANNVAFDIATPLTVLLGRLGFLEAMEGSLETSVNKQIRIIKEHAHRISSTVSKLQIFASMDCEEPKSIVPLNLLKRSATGVSTADNSINIDCVLEAETGRSSPLIKGDEALLQQAFEAIIKCVSKSSIGSDIYASTGNCAISDCIRFEIQCRRRQRLDDDGWQRLESSSTQALGFDVSVAVIIFAYHSGALFYKSIDGTPNFRVRLPREHYLKTGPRDSGLKRRVLLVDDDEALLTLSREIIELEGHICDCVITADEALVILESQKYDLIITDVRLPGISGLAFREIAEAKWPDLQGRFVFVTGLSLQSTPGVRLLQKPFTPKQLINVVLNSPP
jgi:CheY-like chemotaxis protein